MTNNKKNNKDKIYFAYDIISHYNSVWYIWSSETDRR